MMQAIHDHEFPLEEVLTSISNLDTPDLEYFQQEVSLLLAKRKKPSLKERESILLQKISNRSDPSLWRTYHALHEKMQDEIITPDERQILLSLTDEIENTNVEWLKSIVELAQLRGITPQILMRQLGLTSAHAHENS